MRHPAITTAHMVLTHLVAPTCFRNIHAVVRRKQTTSTFGHLRGRGKHAADTASIRRPAVCFALGRCASDCEKDCCVDAASGPTPLPLRLRVPGAVNDNLVEHFSNDSKKSPPHQHPHVAATRVSLLRTLRSRPELARRITQGDPQCDLDGSHDPNSQGTPGQSATRQHKRADELLQHLHPRVVTRRVAPSFDRVMSPSSLPLVVSCPPPSPHRFGCAMETHRL